MVQTNHNSPIHSPTEDSWVVLTLFAIVTRVGRHTLAHVFLCTWATVPLKYQELSFWVVKHEHLQFQLEYTPFCPGVQSGGENSGVSEYLCRADQLEHQLMLLGEGGKKSCIHCHKTYLNNLCLLPKPKSENIRIGHLIKYLYNTIISSRVSWTDDYTSYT